MKRDFAQGAAWSAAASWLEQAAAAVIFLVIAQLIGVESFGITSMAFAFLFLGEFLVRDTVTEAIVERHALEEGRLEATFVALSGFSFVIVLGLVVLAPIVAAIYGEPMVAALLIVASPTVLMIGLAGVSTALLRRQLAYKALAIRSVVGVTVGGAVGIVMALNDFGAWSLVGQRLAEIGINSMLAFKAAGWLPKRWPRRSDFALLKGLGPRVVGLRSIMLVITQTPTVMLGIFAEPRAAGLFAFALRLTDIVLTVSVKPLQGVAQSAIAALRRQQSATTQFYLDLTELAAIIGFVALAGLALIAYPLTDVLLGPEWSEASAILPILCLAGAVAAITAVQEAYLLAIDRLRPFVAAAAVEAVVGLVIVALASRYGPVAAAAGVALRALVSLPLRTAAALAPEAIAPAEFVRALIAPILVASGMAAVVGAWRLAVLGYIPDAIYVASAVFVGILAVGILLFGLMPKTVARLRTFTQVQE
ncbi:MAG: oligosaccharide flippase family protein [Paracoccaceae bacterium]